MFIYDDLEKPIKTDLLLDTLNLVGIIPYFRKSKVNLNNQLKYEKRIDDNIHNAFCELARPTGEYELIFPTTKAIQKYKKYFINNSEENIIFWNKIISSNQTTI